MNEIIDYILSFLLYGNTQAVKRIGYTDDANLWAQFDVVILPNRHLGKDIVLPDMSHPVIEQQDKTYVIHTDIIYNTFFFISRAEELINTQRDEHGRFLASYSILGQDNNLEIPVIDEYAHILIKLLNMPVPAPHYEHIYLTHDIDSIARYRHLRGVLGGIRRGKIRQVINTLHDITQDPIYTFPWLVGQDKQVPNAEMVYFVKYTNGRGYDYPQYNLSGQDYQHVRQYLLSHKALLGIHSSYYGVTDNDTHISRGIQETSTLHRSHYLNCSIDTMQHLADMGITDDFSMAFPDRAGFRLQTTRPVRWINPKTYTLTPLTLHPLTIMDGTLSNTNYMNLPEDEAYFFSEQLLDRVRQYAGEVVLLWHNSVFADVPYHYSLYTKLLKGLRHYSHHEEQEQS